MLIRAFRIVHLSLIFKFYGMGKSRFWSILFCIFSILSLFSCWYTQNDKKQKKEISNTDIVADSFTSSAVIGKKDSVEEKTEENDERPERGENAQYVSVSNVDTVSLYLFWKTFQKNIRTGNKKGVIEVLDFPIHAIVFATFQFSYDCDTLKFIQNEKKYLAVDIDKNNIEYHFGFVFSEILKKMIQGVSPDDLLKKSLKSSDKEVIYPFFVRDFMPKGNCYFDHRIYFYFQQINGIWRISISGE